MIGTELSPSSADRLSPATVGSTDHTGWLLDGLLPAPEEEWDRLKAFVDLGPADVQAMLQTVDVLLRRGHELVVGTYDHLLHNPETAAILGWESGPDPAHLAERRRFFAVWLGRTLGLDLGHDFARALFRAGQVHAGHGPRQIEVPEVYVTGAVSLVHATFARFLQEEMPGAPVVPAALAGWNKTLTLHLHLMLLGYRTALDLDAGEVALPVTFYGRLRTLLGRPAMTIHLPAGATVAPALRKFFNYYPRVRREVCDLVWQQGERLDARGAPWMTVTPAYRTRYGWRLLVNGRNIAHGAGLDTPIQPGDRVQFFPPGR